MKKPVIAIDGYSSTGKSSISKSIAKKMGIIHLDTGSLYRAVTYFALQNCKNNSSEINLDCLIKKLPHILIELQLEQNQLVLFLNGNNISKEIREPEIAKHVSDIAKIQEVRNFLLSTQRTVANKGGIIMDGRDIGTVVLPNADYKFFMTASIDERTKRRYNELISNGVEIDIESVKNNLITRDKIDSERELAPLKKADDAILIDNTNLTKEETVELILSYIKS